MVSRAAWSWTYQGFTAPTATPRPREAAGLDLDAVFDFSAYTAHAAEIVGRLDAIVA